MKKWVLRSVAAVGGLLALSIAALAAMGMRESAGLSVSTVEIGASAERIWPWLVEPEKFKQWVAWVVDVEVANPEVQGVGRRSVVTMNEPGSAEAVRINTVWTQYWPTAMLASDVEFPGLFTGSQAIKLEPVGNGSTRVQVETRIRYTSWLVRLFEPLATPSSTKKTDEDLQALKRLVESSAQPYAQ